MDYSILKEQILDDIKQNRVVSANTRTLNYLIKNNKATYQTVADYSKILGDAVSQSIERNIKEGIPDNELESFANECLVPIYKQSQNTMLNACKDVQTSYNLQAGIGLMAAEVRRDDSRTQNIANRFREATSFDDVSFLTNENVSRSITRGAVNDSIYANSKMQSDAGLKIRISRSDGAGCCDWCSTLVGDYDSFDKLPTDFWKVHRNCNCVIDYRVGNTRNRISFEEQGGNLVKVTNELEESAIPTSTPATATPSSINEKVNEIESILKTNNVAYNPVERADRTLSADEIIEKIAGGDMTSGSCASLCLAYMGNQDGLDVTDFRGGKSQDVFSRYSTLDKIFSLEGVVKKENKEYNGIKAAYDLMKQMEEGKEYCLLAGKHASMVRLIDGKYQYLELQSATKSGWTPFDGNPRYTLKQRFGATQRSTVYGFKLEQRATLIEADSMKGNKDFQNLLGYINTNETEQKKGALGFVK